MYKKLQQAIEITKKYGQQHLVQYYDELSDEEQDNLLDQILSIDFEFISSLYSDLVVNNNAKELKSDISPLKAVNFNECAKEEKENYYNMGLEAIKNGKVGVLLVAGGQGSRLGYNGPKGRFSIGLPSNKSLFQLQCEKLMSISKKAGKYITWYIMTSPENHKDTVSFFERNDYFGYPKEDVKFFKQGILQTIDSEGKILLDNKGNISTGANGNGGCFIALKDSGMLEDISNRGIEWMFIYGIDNALAKVADPYFIGFTIASGQMGSSKVVAKKNAGEKVGVLCYKNGHPSIVEYSELPNTMAFDRDENGKLVYDNANIVSHILHVDFIKESLKIKIPFHVAHKKITYIDEQGVKVKPDKPNGYKFETFLFDIFQGLSDMAALKVIREDEFAPVKNAEGEDSPKTARELTLNLHKKWLINAGIDAELLKDKVIEISPLTSYAGENIDLEKVKDELLKENVVQI